MIFIHPMWDSENQRLGMRACTRPGYFLRELGDGMGFIGIILLLATIAYLAYQFFRHQLSIHHLWSLLIPFFFTIIGRLLFEFGWRLAAKRHFQYDYDNRIARWIDAGHEKVFPETPQH
jgi:hypothetical protein